MSRTKGDARGTLSRSNPRGRRWLSLAIVGVASVGVLLPLFNAGSPALLYPSLLVLLCGVAVFTTADRDPGPSRGVEGRLRVTDDELVARSEVAGEWALSLPRGDVVDGWLEPHTADRGRTLVLVARNGMQLRLSRDDRMADGPAAAPLQALLRKLGLDERVVRIPLVPEHRGFRGCMGMFMGLLLVVCALMVIFVVIALFQGDTSTLVMLPVMLVVFLPVLAMPHFLVANRVLVGREGVLLKQLFRPSAFVAYGQLRGAAHDEAYLQLSTSDDVLVSIRASGGAGATAARIIEQRLRSYQRDDSELVVAALDRGGRSVDEWKASLSALLDPAAGNFRRGAIQADHLLALVSDPRATPARRVGAAFALVAHDKSSESCLRDAVEGCAEPALRRALERASLGEIDEAALARAQSVAAEAS